ncbi:substrate-binding domain-containing protein [Pseudomonas sp. SWRI92]|uniref:substrate-binding domain-containing protein n=1 Tax=Pseudomonas sp. SWRI92 TaxID=2745499 RepID=UPI0016465BF9|nr:substrate-binding domain-containing protein [Pseudomonas sp. SWRI92]MBC3375856.1 substrate-binding domain-containing protein [Pseudomonas sp. SWRI92]
MYKNFVSNSVMALALVLSGAQAMAAVVGGGADARQILYGMPPTGGVAAPVGILNDPKLAFADYVGVGSGAGKTAFLTNNSDVLVWNLDGNSATALEKVYVPAVTVDYAGSDSILTSAELTTYRAAHQSPAVPTGNAANWGPIIQIPAEATSVTVPYKLTLVNGTAVNNLNLTSAQLCHIFSGTVTTWNQINSAYPTTPIKVYYRAGSSGTSEIFTRHLNSQCPTKFTTNGTFTTAVGIVPANATAVNGSAAMASTVRSTEGGIGYVGPTYVNAGDNAQVARVNGNMPTVGNATTALSTIAPPVSADRGLPENWTRVLPNPATGYSIVGYTFMVFNQCYKDSTDNTAVRRFINRHYTHTDLLNDDDEIIAAKLIPITNTWKTAVRETFFTATNSLSVGNTTACNGIGRPL